MQGRQQSEIILSSVKLKSNSNFISLYCFFFLYIFGVILSYTFLYMGGNEKIFDIWFFKILKFCTSKF